MRGYSFLFALPFFNFGVFCYLGANANTSSHQIASHDSGALPPLERLNFNISSADITSNVNNPPRQPGFKVVVNDGWEIIARLMGSRNVPIRRIFNNQPSKQGSSNLNDYEHIQLDVIIPCPTGPTGFQYINLADAQTWAHWPNSIHGGGYVPPGCETLGFYPPDITMDEDAALAALIRDGKRGPWLSIELCKLRAASHALSYVFQRAEQLPDRMRKWDSVEVGTRKTSVRLRDQSPCNDLDSYVSAGAATGLFLVASGDGGFSPNGSGLVPPPPPPQPASGFDIALGESQNKTAVVETS